MDFQAAHSVLLESTARSQEQDVASARQEPTPTRRVQTSVPAVQKTLTPVAQDGPSVPNVRLGRTLGAELHPALIVLLASSAEQLELVAPFVHSTLTL